MLIVTIILFPLSLAACGIETKTVQLKTEPVRSETGGFQIRLPEGWEHQSYWWGIYFTDGTSSLGVWAPSVSITVITPEPERWWPPDAQSALSEIWEIGFADEGARMVGSITNTTVGGKEAAFLDYTYPFEDPQPMGRLVYVFLGDRSFFIEGGAKHDDWIAFLSAFEAMLESMEFFEPQANE